MLDLCGQIGIADEVVERGWRIVAAWSVVETSTQRESLRGPGSIGERSWMRMDVERRDWSSPRRENDLVSAKLANFCSAGRTYSSSRRRARYEYGIGESSSTAT